MKLKVSNTYIISSFNSPHKIKVLEITETTYYLHNLDSDTKYRIDKVDFENSNVITELVEDGEQKLLDMLNNLPTYMDVKYNIYPSHSEHYRHPCDVSPYFPIFKPYCNG